MPTLSVLHVVASINPHTGGPAVSVTGLAGALMRRGLRTSIAALDYSEHGMPIAVEGVQIIQRIPGAAGKRLRGWSPAFGGAMAKAASLEVDLIHNHGLWMYPGIYARRTANRFSLPLVISPRGMLDSWSLKQKAFRKTLAAIAYERRNLRAARIFHATSDMEAEAIRQYGLKQPIAVIPNGVDLPDGRAVTPRELLEARFPQLRNRRWLLYMGRIHPKKGLDLLLDAWSGLHADFPAWHLVIAGPDSTGLNAELEATVSGNRALRNSITFSGMLDGPAKGSALANAELFVLPTRSENFGIAVAEALAFGLPVVTTTAAPWSDLVARDCGWWIAPEKTAIAGALREAMNRTTGELQVLGKRGRQLVSERLSWDTVGARMATVYRWIIGGGSAPACVRET